METKGSLHALATGAILLFTSVGLSQIPSTAPGANSAAGQAGSTTTLLAPPAAPVKEVVDELYGTRVSDPYRYLENLNDPEVEAWFKGQNDYTRTVLGRIPGRAKLLARISKLDQSVPFVEARRLPGDMYLIRKLLPNEDTSKVYLRKGLKGSDCLLVDPAKIRLNQEDQAKGKNEVDFGALSDDGKFIAVTITPGGSETNSELRVFEVATGRQLPDVIAHGACIGGEPCVFWLPDRRSFVYRRLQDLPPGAPPERVEQNIRAYLHVLGTDPAADKAVFGNGVARSIEVDPSLVASVIIAPGSKYAIGVLNTSVSPNSAYYITPVEVLANPDTVWHKVSDFADDVTDIAVWGDDLYLLTFKDAPRYKLIRTDARRPNLASAKVVVPSGEAVINGFYSAKDALYVHLMDGGLSRLLRVPYRPETRPEPVSLPFNGALSGINSDPRIMGILMFEGTWTWAGSYFIYDPGSKQVTETGLQPIGLFDKPEDLVSEEIRVPSHDGVMVPLSIVHKKGIRRDGANPALLDGYGGYSRSMTPIYDAKMLAWYEAGGMYAMCHVRGGGEYGEEWHLAGKGPTKSNTWLDFIACGQYLIDKKYTSPARLAGTGASAGGILIGRAITERPDLFAAAVIKVGSLDMLRSEFSPNGETNISEFGTVKAEEGFKSLYQMSAYHHVKDHTPYPAVLLTTGINDPRVDPWHTGKMTARLQAATSSGKPVLLRVDYGGGHGGGSGEEETRQTLADQWSFLLWQFGMPGFQLTQ